MALQKLQEEQLAKLEAKAAAQDDETTQSAEHKQLNFLRDRLIAEFERGEAVGVLEGTVGQIREMEDALIQAGKLPAFASSADHCELLLAIRKLRELTETMVKSDGR